MKLKLNPHLRTQTEGTTRFDLETSLALLHHVELLQIQYGALILSFLGAIHWGFEVRLSATSVPRAHRAELPPFVSQFAGFGGQKGISRYMLGIAPVLVGWGSMLVPGSQLALITQWAGFNALWFVDQKATNQGWTPKWYSTVSSCLIFVTK